eukprot:1537300-Pleurochrysis_carterae.AAC.1
MGRQSVDAGAGQHKSSANPGRCDHCARLTANGRRGCKHGYERKLHHLGRFSGTHTELESEREGATLSNEAESLNQPNRILCVLRQNKARDV